MFQELLPLIRENLPQKLAEVAWDRVESQFPVQYQVRKEKRTAGKSTGWMSKERREEEM